MDKKKFYSTPRYYILNEYGTLTILKIQYYEKYIDPYRHTTHSGYNLEFSVIDMSRMYNSLGDTILGDCLIQEEKLPDLKNYYLMESEFAYNFLWLMSEAGNEIYCRAYKIPTIKKNSSNKYFIYPGPKILWRSHFFIYGIIPDKNIHSGERYDISNLSNFYRPNGPYESFEYSKGRIYINREESYYYLSYPISKRDYDKFIKFSKMKIYELYGYLLNYYAKLALKMISKKDKK